MMRLLSVVLLCCGATLFAADAPKKVFPFAYSQEELANGLRLVTIPTGFPTLSRFTSSFRPDRAMKWKKGNPATRTCSST